MNVRVFYHDNCFDGAASAAYFSRFLRDTRHPDAEFSYQGLAHKAADIFGGVEFNGDVNAIVDFKYSPDPKLTWWFDHHQSAFLSAQDQEEFERGRDPQKMYDPSFKSCTKYIATMAAERYGYAIPADLEELVRWADIIDGASYESADEAVMLRSAAPQLVLVIENAKRPETLHGIIRAMQRMTLDEIMALPEIQELYLPLYERHRKSIDVIRSATDYRDGVVFFDLVSHGLDSYNKFIPYYLFPDSVYTVSVSVSSFRSKVSVGSNPWVREIPYNLASICERYGGGGHARVGAISFPVPAVEEARRAAGEIAGLLRG
jgi:hypothetical protein